MSAPREVWVVVDSDGLPIYVHEDRNEAAAYYDGHPEDTIHRYTLHTAPALTAGEREAVENALSSAEKLGIPAAEGLRALLARCVVREGEG